MARNKDINNIKSSIIEAIQKTGSIGFDLSQHNCPVITGYLKRSGKERNLENGHETQYDAEYSSFVERGSKSGIRNVRSYRKRNGAIVRSYSYYSKGQKAQKFIGRGLTEAFSNFGDTLFNQLKLRGFRIEKM